MDHWIGMKIRYYFKKRFLYRKGKLILKLNNNIFVMFCAPRQRFPYCKMQNNRCVYLNSLELKCNWIRVTKLFHIFNGNFESWVIRTLWRWKLEEPNNNTTKWNLNLIFKDLHILFHKKIWSLCGWSFNEAKKPFESDL